jgi:hypothetical protein
MAQSTAQNAHQEMVSTQEIALHMIASAARVLLMIGTAVLVGEVAAGPARRLIAARRHSHDHPESPVAADSSSTGEP